MVRRLVRPVVGSVDLWHRQFGLLLIAALVALGATVAIGWISERAERGPLIRAGRPAPDFTVPTSQGNQFILAGERGHPVVLAFVPSMLCGTCKRQLQTLQAALPELTARGATVYAISTDEREVQRTVARSLHLTYPLLAEDVIIDRHPAGHAYGVFHVAGAQQRPVDAAAIVVIDADGVVQAVDARPAGRLTTAELVNLVDHAGPISGGGQ